MRRRVLVTRAAGQASSLSRLLEEAGFDPVEHPAIAFVPGDLRSVLDALPEADWVLFTSVNAVRFFFEACPQSVAARVGAIGPATAEALAARGVTADFVPSVYQSEPLARGLPEAAGATVLLPQAADARPVLAELLEARGARVVTSPAYRTVTAPGGPAPGNLDAVTFTSPSTVTGFLEQGGRVEEAVIACIGAVTASAAQKAGMRVQVQADPQTTRGLVEGLVHHFKGSP